MLVASGAVLGILIASRRSKRLGLDPDAFTRLAGWVLLGGFIGARLAHVFLYHWADYKDNLGEIVQLWKGGLSSYGGFVGATVAGALYVRRAGMPFFPYADVTSYGFLPAWAVGRLGCFVIHDHPGRLSDFFLAAEMKLNIGTDVHPNIVIQARHELGLYDGILTAVIALIFVVADRRPRRSGFFLGWMCVLYAIPRFFLDFLRATDLSGSDARYAGLTPAQYGSIILVLLGGWILWLRPHDVQPESR